jgi:hypothetical protein
VIQGESSLAVTGKGIGQEPGEGFSTVCGNGILCSRLEFECNKI